MDQQRLLYGHLNLRRGFKYALAPKALLMAKAAFAEGHSQSATQGDTLYEFV